MTKFTPFFVLGCLGMVISAPAAAEVNPYVGINLIYDHATLFDELGNYVTLATGCNIETDDIINPNHLGFSLNLGVQFNEHVGVEAFYHHSFESEAELDFYSIYGHEVIVNDVTSNNFGIDLMGYLPVNNTNFSFVGSLGIGEYKFHVEEKYTGFGSSIHLSGSESNPGFRIGVGGQLAFSDKWSSQLMVRYVILDSDNEKDVVDDLVEISLGLRYTF